MKKFKIYDIDQGYCRVNYVATNDLGQTVQYCIQDEGSCLILYRSTPDWEPSNAVNLRPGVKRSELFEVPMGNTQLEQAVRNWIQED